MGNDTVPAGSNARAFAKGGAESLVGAALLERLRQWTSSMWIWTPRGCSVVHIEVRLEVHRPDDRAKRFASLDVGACALANDQIMDLGAARLRSIIAALDSLGITHFGAAGDLRVATASFTFEADDLSVGEYACSEHEFSIAGEGSPDVNPFDPLISHGHVADLMARYDFVAVLYHGGKEDCRYPFTAQEGL